MKKFTAFVLALLLLSLPAAVLADITGNAFDMACISEMQYYGSGAVWSKSQSGGEYTETTTLNGNRYSMYVHYEMRNSIEKAYEMSLRGPYGDLQPDVDPYTEYGSGYTFLPGLNFYTAFFTALYDLGVMPDNENCGCFFEAGMLSPYGVWRHLTEGRIDDYDRSTWRSGTCSRGYIEALHVNGTRVVVSGSPGGTFEVYVRLP